MPRPRTRPNIKRLYAVRFENNVVADVRLRPTCRGGGGFFERVGQL